jgi:hypothetical protein
VQTQRDRELKKGGKVTRMEAEAKELETVATKLRIQAEIEEGAIKYEEAAREASGRELSEVRASFHVICFTMADHDISPSVKLSGGEKGASRCCHCRVQCHQRTAHTNQTSFAIIEHLLLTQGLGSYMCNCLWCASVAKRV